MTLKKQFSLLIIFTIAIPMISTTFLLIQNYMHSSKRYLIDGYASLDKIEEENKDYKDGIKFISLLPNTVEATLIATDTSKIICSTIPELKNQNDIEQVWPIIKTTYKDYYYQFTSPKTQKDTLLITRVPKKSKRLTNPEIIITTLLILFSIGILISIVSILIISKTIFNSIIEIKTKTQELANGDLTQPIIIYDTQKKQNEIMSILESLEIMRQSLCDAEQRKNYFIMSISHDLRTPVAIIKGYTEAISDGIINNQNDINDAITLIGSKTEQLEIMIDDLINFTKFNNYELTETLKTESITELIKYFAKEMELSTNVFKRDIVCTIDIKDNILLPINKKLVLRALQNIYVNALRYTGDGDKIFITAVENKNNIILEIKDTGCGISKKDLPHIFDLFYRSSNSRNGKNMGIGLSVVKSVIDVHGWSISVSSTKNIGTSFKIKIPIINNLQS